MDLLDPQVEGHLDSLSDHGDPVMEEMEARAARDGFPIIGRIAGRLLYQVARMVRARSVFELGSGYGYSTLWFAKAVRQNGGGTVYHTVWDEKLSRDARGYIRRAGYDDLVSYRVSESVAALQSVQGPFDVIFNDIEKQGYPASIPVIKEKLKSGGALLVDNVLWQGRIFDRADASDSTRGVWDVTRLLFEDPDFSSSILPLRDGVLLAVKAG